MMTKIAVITLVLLIGAGIFLILPAKADPLAEGVAAPTLSVTDQDGQTLDLGNFYQKGYTLVYFYPKADTPGCTKQACNLRDAFSALTEKKLNILGVSTDKPESQKAFKDKYSLPFTLIADEKAVLAKAFGVSVSPIGFTSRQSFLIDSAGKIIWRDLKAAPAQQAEDALAALVAHQSAVKK
jgi:thioredoxin-dependent peroxiredoxin